MSQVLVAKMSWRPTPKAVTSSKVRLGSRFSRYTLHPVKTSISQRLVFGGGSIAHAMCAAAIGCGRMRSWGNARCRAARSQAASRRPLHRKHGRRSGERAGDIMLTVRGLRLRAKSSSQPAAIFSRRHAGRSVERDRETRLRSKAEVSGDFPDVPAGA